MCSCKCRMDGHTSINKINRKSSIQSQVCIMLSNGINIKNEGSVRKKEQCCSVQYLRGECEIRTIKICNIVVEHC